MKKYFIGYFCIVAFAVASHANAELVFEDGSTAEIQKGVQAEDRANLRQALGSAIKAENVAQPAPIAPVTVQAPTPVTQVPVQLVPVQAAPQQAQAQPEVEHLSKTDMMRRERMREELKNEDLLQERLEELRLRDEKDRGKQVLGAGGAEVAAPEPAKVTAAKIETQGVVAPVTEKPGEPQIVPVGTVASAAPVSAVQTEASEGTLAGLSANTQISAPRTTRFTVLPRVGIASVVGSTLELRPHVAAGLAISAAASDHVAVEVGWTYSELGIMNSSLLFGAEPTVYSPNQESMSLKQNTFDVGVKLHFMGRDSVIRPFISGGGAYALGNVNYSQAYIGYLNQTGRQAFAGDYRLDSFMGYLGAGMDVQITNHLTIGASFRYYAMFSMNATASMAPGAATYGGYGYNYAYAYTNPAALNVDKQAVGNAVSQSGQYAAMLGMSLTF